MTNGFYFDLYALAFAAIVAATTALIYALRAKHAGKCKPHDWATEWPEYACAKEAHITVVPYAYDAIVFDFIDGQVRPSSEYHWRASDDD